MVTKLEKQFFDTFGIEKRCEFDKYCEDCKTCGCYNYPRLTDRRLLELICILASNPVRILFESMLSGIKEVELLKNSILLTCIANKDSIKQQVQALFKEVI